MDDSKELWKSLDQEIRATPLVLGRYTADDFINNPKQVCIVASRYKFVSKMLANIESALEIGCGDGFGSCIVAKSVGSLLCTDINEELLADNTVRNTFLKNVEYRYVDFRETSLNKKVDSAFLVDVIEHIFPKEEETFLDNIMASIKDHGVLLIGTPNKAAEQYASEWSKRAHINLKTFEELREIGLKRFHNVFMFGMNDEVLHTGYPEMCHFLWAVCTGPRR
ncbi:MAG: hypothetical protein CMF70_03100 [Magnetovibrio sp.]|nr:hypothetical protein [Magnetovibrio sp.]